MNKVAHLAGPWEYSAGAIWAKSPWNAPVRIAEVIQHSPMNGIDSEANARLIAAAPDLLEALKGCLDQIGDSEYPVTSKIARRAIAMAQGAAVRHDCMGNTKKEPDMSDRFNDAAILLRELLEVAKDLRDNYITVVCNSRQVTFEEVTGDPVMQKWNAVIARAEVSLVD